MSHREVNRLPFPDAPGQVHHDAVTQVASVIQTNESDGSAIRAAEMFKDALAAETTHRIFADRVRHVALARSAILYRRKTVDVSRRECDDSAATILAADDPRQIAVHRPGHRLATGRAEFP